ncbi:thioredoxin [Cellvibrio zantedeschiae]|uniref:Thioredoxin n=1 Tax=Cellvibrio zantedeschiae TaxID=1237077 RepID=A0ABQ3AXL7_9GAMM|nr:thioredoxin [Cellvibrio zantedeschiae]GGY67245.1 thioredoxin [Cellvibrio zantedeschiae]
MNVVEINLENAQQYLIEESFARPVLIDFWADWCAPCKSLMPILEKLANEYAGAFLLAKVNADEMNMISSQFGVRSLPTVMLMKDGQPIDGFAGALPEKQVRELLEKHLPKPWEKFVNEAQAFIMSGDFNSALPLLRQAYEDSQQDAAIACLLAQCHLELNRLDNAEAILASVKMADQDAHYEQLKAQIELKKQAAKTPELVALEAAHANEPNNLQIAYELAIQYHAEATHRPALELLIEILRKERNFGEGAAKKTFMDILAALGKGDPLAIEFQRKLFTLLY